MKLKCQCCGFEQEFKDKEAAYDAGWDAPPMFSYVSCNLCPGVCVMLRIGHKIAHALWDKEGRPSEFSLEKCATDGIIGDSQKIKTSQDDIDRLRETIADPAKVKAELLARAAKAKQ